MHVHQEQFNVRTDGKGTYEITGDVQAKIDKCGVRNGAVTVFVHHTSCSLIVMENADPTARKDLEEFFERLVPENSDYFVHTTEGESYWGIFLPGELGNLLWTERAVSIFQDLENFVPLDGYICSALKQG